MNITREKIDKHYGQKLDELYEWKMARLKEGFDPFKVNCLYKEDKKNLLDEHCDICKAFIKMEQIS